MKYSKIRVILYSIADQVLSGLVNIYVSVYNGGSKIAKLLSWFKNKSAAYIDSKKPSVAFRNDGL